MTTMSSPPTTTTTTTTTTAAASPSSFPRRRILNLCYLAYVSVFEVQHKMELMDNFLLQLFSLSVENDKISSASYRFAVVLRAVRLYLCYIAADQFLSTIGTYVHRSLFDSRRPVYLLYYYACATFAFTLVPLSNVYVKLALSLVLCRRYLVFKLFSEHSAPLVDLGVLTIASFCAFIVRRAIILSPISGGRIVLRMLIGLFCGLMLVAVANHHEVVASRRDYRDRKIETTTATTATVDVSKKKGISVGDDKTDKQSIANRYIFTAMLCFQQLSAKLLLMIGLLWAAVLAYPANSNLYVPIWPFGSAITTRFRTYIETLVSLSIAPYTLLRADVYLVAYYTIALILVTSRSIFADAFRRAILPRAQYSLLISMLLYNLVGVLSVFQTNNFLLIGLVFAALAVQELLVAVFPYPYETFQAKTLLVQLIFGQLFALFVGLSATTWLVGIYYVFCAPAVVMFFLAAVLFALPYRRQRADHYIVASVPASTTV